MDITDVSPPCIQTHLPDRLKEREDFDIPSSATDFRNNDVNVRCCKSPNPSLNFISDMRNNLDSLTEVVSMTFGG